jgi:hypothetical protein
MSASHEAVQAEVHKDGELPAPDGEEEDNRASIIAQGGLRVSCCAVFLFGEKKEERRRWSRGKWEDDDF